MSSSLAISATTTYPFTYTTISTTHASTTFTRPTSIPTLFSFAPAYSCPSSFSHPALAQPTGSPAACLISNANETNSHAFWDIYACCSAAGGEISAFGGSPGPCNAQCGVKNGDWKSLGECLGKRVEMVVCKPDDKQIGSASVSGSASMSGTPTRSASVSGVTGSASRSAAAASSSTASSGGNGGVGSGGAKVGAVVFGLLAVGAAAGMAL